MLHCGRIKYTNDLPIYAAFDAGAIEYPGTLHADVPARLNAMLLRGELDMGPVSAFAWAANSDRLVLLPDLCIGAREEVVSVVLVSRKPPALLGSSKVYVSEESASGRYLLRIILEQRYRVRPKYVDESEPRERASAGDPTLLIGDAAIDAIETIPGRDRLRSGKAVARVERPPDGVRRVGRAPRRVRTRSRAVSRLHARADRRVHVVALALGLKSSRSRSARSRVPRASTRATSENSTSCSTPPRATAWRRIAASSSRSARFPTSRRRCGRAQVPSLASLLDRAAGGGRLDFEEGLRLYNEARHPRARRRGARAAHADAFARVSLRM